jgi:hypothetical protein
MFGKGDYETTGYETATVKSTASRLPSKIGTDSSGLLLTIETANNELIAKLSLQGQYPVAGSTVCLRKLRHLDQDIIRFEIAPDKYCKL